MDQPPAPGNSEDLLIDLANRRDKAAIERKVQADAYVENVRNAKQAMLFIGVVNVGAGCYGLHTLAGLSGTNSALPQQPSGIDQSAIEAASYAYTAAIAMGFGFLGLRIYARRQPLKAICIASAIFLGDQLYTAATNPSMLTQGWILRFTIIYVLGRALIMALSNHFDAPSPASRPANHPTSQA